MRASSYRAVGRIGTLYHRLGNRDFSGHCLRPLKAGTFPGAFPSNSQGGMLFLTSSPLWLSGFILIVPATLRAMAGPFIVRRYISLSRLRTNNEIAGFKFATVGVLYAVLLAFAVIVVWEKFNDADNRVAAEAGAAATVYRLANGIEGEQGEAIRTVMSRYLNLAIARDWPAMQQGKASREATDALSEIYVVVLKYRPADNSGAILLSELLRQVDLVGQARRARHGAV